MIKIMALAGSLVVLTFNSLAAFAIENRLGIDLESREPVEPKPAVMGYLEGADAAAAFAESAVSAVTVEGHSTIMSLRLTTSDNPQSGSGLALVCHKDVGRPEICRMETEYSTDGNNSIVMKFNVHSKPEMSKMVYDNFRWLPVLDEFGNETDVFIFGCSKSSQKVDMLRNHCGTSFIYNKRTGLMHIGIAYR